MPIIKLKGDNLHLRNGEFYQTILKQPLFLNSIPKCGSHLMRNIMRMFVPVEQHYRNQFIQLPTLQRDSVAWDKMRQTLSWGHLLFTDESAMLLKDTRKILLVRDPYDWVLARARFFMSAEFAGSLDHLKDGQVSVEELLNIMIFGTPVKTPPMSDIYIHNGVSWLGTNAYVVKFEDLLYHVKNLDKLEAEVFFRNLFDKCGLDIFPDDWRERVRIGSDKEQSGTARENLTGHKMEFPKQLPEAQKRLVDFAVPGLRKVLGYE